MEKITLSKFSKEELKSFLNAVVNDKDKASRSLRISLSYLTTKEELDKFISVF